MKNNKILVIILVLFLNIVVGFMVGKNIKTGDSEYTEYIKSAQSLTEEGLCSKAIEAYKKAVAIEDTVDLRIAMIDTYAKGIDIGEFTKTYTIFSEIESVVDSYRRDVGIYESACSFFNKYGERQKCANLLMQARDLEITSDALEDLREQVRYLYEKNYSMYTTVFPQLTGVYTVVNDDKYKFVDTEGSTFLDEGFSWASNFNEGFAVVKMTGADSTEQMFVVDENNARQFYLPETAQTSSGAGKIIVSEDNTYLAFAVKDGEKYYYLDINGKKLLNGAEFDFAGRFRNNVSAVKEGSGWFVIDYKGNKLNEAPFEDIILNEFDECAAKGIVIAKTGDKYHLYRVDAAKLKINKIGEFECDYAKAFVDDYAAFMSDEKWGYVDSEGKIIIEPSYEDAKSFSNGLAAVKVDPSVFNQETADKISENASPVETQPTQPVENKTEGEVQNEQNDSESVNPDEDIADEPANWAVINKDNRIVFDEGFQTLDYLSSNGFWFVKADGYWSAIKMYYTGK